MSIKIGNVAWFSNSILGGARIHFVILKNVLQSKKK